MARFSEVFGRRASRVRYLVRKRSFGKFRLSVFRSERHIYVQLIDDAKRVTLCSASTLEKEVRDVVKTSGCAAAVKIGELIAARASKSGIKDVVFDRGGYKYHGRVKALAEAARAGGLIF